MLEEENVVGDDEPEGNRSGHPKPVDYPGLYGFCHPDADAPCLCNGLLRSTGKRSDPLPFSVDDSGMRHNSSGTDVERQVFLDSPGTAPDEIPADCHSHAVPDPGNPGDL